MDETNGVKDFSMVYLEYIPKEGVISPLMKERKNKRDKKRQEVRSEILYGRSIRSFKDEMKPIERIQKNRQKTRGARQNRKGTGKDTGKGTGNENRKG